MKVGVVLPTFHSDPARCLRLAEDAEANGLDGVFFFDHLWHLGKKGRPALHGPTLMGAVLAHTKRVVVGSLVARIGIQHDGVLAAMFATMDRMDPGRVLAGLGIGDGLSRDENEAFGLPFPPRPERLSQLISVSRELRNRGLPVWIGGSTPAIWQIAAAEADAVNLWNTPVAMTEEAASHVAPAAVTWAGFDPRPEGGVSQASHLGGLASAGVDWAIYAPLAGDDGLAGRLAVARQEAGE